MVILGSVSHNCSVYVLCMYSLEVRYCMLLVYAVGGEIPVRIEDLLMQLLFIFTKVWLRRQFGTIQM
jgi:hypothetical protein